MKSIPRSEIDENYMKNFLYELDIMKSLDHQNIIEFQEIFVDKHYFHIVMELCYGMNLFDYVQKYKRVEEKAAATVIKQVLKAIKYLHMQEICHRDLKLENIIFTTKNDDFEIKLIDFGLSHRI